MASTMSAGKPALRRHTSRHTLHVVPGSGTRCSPLLTPPPPPRRPREDRVYPTRLARRSVPQPPAPASLPARPCPSAATQTAEAIPSVPATNRSAHLADCAYRKTARPRVSTAPLARSARMRIRRARAPAHSCPLRTRTVLMLAAGRAAVDGGQGERVLGDPDADLFQPFADGCLGDGLAVFELAGRQVPGSVRIAGPLPLGEQDLVAADKDDQGVHDRPVGTSCSEGNRVHSRMSLVR